MIKVAIVGAGYWARNMIRSIHSSNRCEIVAVCDTSVNPLQSFSRLCPSAKLTHDIEEAICGAEVDAVYIATPPDSHFAITHKSLTHGKHVLVEKPMTADSSSAQQLVLEANKRSLTLMVGHTFIFSPAVRKIKSLLENGSMGDVISIDSQRVNLGKCQQTGVIWDLAPHDISTVLYWLNTVPLSITATGRSVVSLSEDVAFLTLEFPDKVIVQLQLSWLSPVKLRRTTISGSKKTIVYDDTNTSETLRVYDYGIERIEVKHPRDFNEFQYSYRLGDVHIPRIDNTEPLRAEWEHFLDCIETGITPESNSLQGLDVVRVIEAAMRSLASGQRECIDTIDVRGDAMNV